MCTFLTGIITSLIAGVLFLVMYEFLIKKAYFYFKFLKLSGRFLHYDKNGVPFIKSPELKANYVDIKLSFWRPNVLINEAEDYDTSIKKWKTWVGKVNMDTLSKEHGIGYFRYKTQPYPGVHEIFVVNKNIFYVRITYYGEKNTSPDLQIWCREGFENEISKFISDYKKL